MVSTQTLLSEEEFLALPDSAGKQELLDGELIEVPPARFFHSKLAKLISILLETAVDPSRVLLRPLTGYAPAVGWYPM